jgi:hypothetical protein
MQDALAKYNRKGRRAGVADVIASVVGLAAHLFLFAATMSVLGFLVMGTDPCAYQQCGDQAWVNRAIALGLWGGGVILVGDLAVTVFRLVRHRVAWFVPVIGCVAQLALAFGAAWMESWAGPV